MKSLDSAHEQCMNTCLLPKQSIQGRLKHRWLTGIPKLPPPHTPQPELSKCSSPTCLSSPPHWSESYHDQGKTLAVRR